MVVESQLRLRGWTKAMVRDLLGSPDKLERNPRFRRAAPTRLFDLGRVEAAERADGFAKIAERAARRSAAMMAVAQRRRDNLLGQVEVQQIVVPLVAEDVLARRAVRHRDARQAKPTDAPALDHRTLERWKVNYLRHQLIAYDSLLDGMYGLTGRLEAARLLRNKVYAAIANAYPDLAAECSRQLVARACS